MKFTTDGDKNFALMCLNSDSLFLNHVTTARQMANRQLDFIDVDDSNEKDIEVYQLCETSAQYEKMGNETKARMKAKLVDLFKQGYYAVYDNNKKRFTEIRKIES